MNQLLVKSGSADRAESWAATREIAKAFTTPLRDGVMSGDVLFNIFEQVDLNGGAAEFPLSFLAPGTEKDFTAYTIPNEGYIPQKHVEGDYVMVPTYEIGNSIDWSLKYARDARWDIVNRCMEVLEAGFVKKFNDDGWHVLLAAGVDRNIIVYDGDANAGQFTKRLVSLMKNVMRRNGGGNSSSLNRRKLTHLAISPECQEDIRNWGVDILDEVSRREAYVASDGSLNKIFDVTLMDMDELGVGQEYQDYFTNALGGSLASGDVELVVGLDLNKKDSFIMPVRKPLEIFEDDMLHRHRKAGLYGWTELGFAALDNRNVIIGSL